MADTRRLSMMALILLLSLMLPATSIAGDVDIAALLKESEEAVDQLDPGADKADLLVILAKVRAKRGDRQQALKMLQCAVQLTGKLPNDTWGRESVFYKAVSIQTRLGDVAGALKNAVSTGEPELDRDGLGCVARGQAEVGDVAGAWATCDRLDPSSRLTVMTFGLVNALADAGRFDASLQAVDRIERLPEKGELTREMKLRHANTCLVWIAEAQARRGQVKAALRTAERTDVEIANALILQKIATIRVSSGDPLSAKEALQRALPVFKRRALRSAFTGLQRSEVEVTTLRKLAEVQAETGDIPGALDTTATFLKGPVKGPALLVISLAQVKSGDRTAAAQTFREGLALAEADQDERSYICLDVIDKYVEAGQFDRALEIGHVFDDLGVVLRKVAVGLVKAGEFDRALKIADSITKDPRERAIALREIASTQAKARRPSAKQTFERALDAARTDQTEVTEIAPWRTVSSRTLGAVSALREIGRAQMLAGDVEPAAHTFTEARARAMGPKADSSAFELIAEAQAAGGDPRGALSWARLQSSRPIKARSLVGVVEGLTEGSKRFDP